MAVEINNATRSRIDTLLVRNVAERFLEVYRKKNKEVSVALVGDRTIRRLNRTYRGLDKVTDILTFEGEGDFLGEIVIDYKQIERQARRLKVGPRRELAFILVHGLLHLLGHTDETEEKRRRMIALGEKFLAENKF